MGRIGRPPKPDAAKKLIGTFRADRARNSSAQASAVPGMPKRPGYLSARAKREWDRVAPVLVDAGLLSEGDGAVLEGYCAAYARAREAEEHIRKHGIVLTTPYGIQANPAVNIAEKAWSAVRQFATKFGLSAGDREGITLPEKRKSDEPGDFLFGPLAVVEGGKGG